MSSFFLFSILVPFNSFKDSLSLIMKRLKVDIFSPSFFTFHAFSCQPNWFITTFNSEGNGEFFFSLKFLMGLVSFLF